MTTLLISESWYIAQNANSKSAHIYLTPRNSRYLIYGNIMLFWPIMTSRFLSPSLAEDNRTLKSALKLKWVFYFRSWDCSQWRYMVINFCFRILVVKADHITFTALKWERGFMEVGTVHSKELYIWLSSFCFRILVVKADYITFTALKWEWV